MGFDACLAKRRAVIVGFIGGASLLLMAPVLAQSAGEDAAAGPDPLKMPAPMVVNPAGVFLVGTTVVGKRVFAVGEHGVIIYSDDNGSSWVQAEVPVNVTLTAISFVDPNTGWVVGNSGVVLKTVDGGKSWKVQLTGTQANLLTLQAAQDPNLATSTLPGAAHAMVRAEHFVQDGPSMPFLTLWVQDAQNITVFGAFRLAMKTQDGGETWQDWSLHIYDTLSHNIYDAVRVDNLTYLVGEVGLVFSSDDEGNNYRPLTAAGQVTLFGLVVAPDGSLVVYGVSGTCLRSTDGGRSWSPVNLNTADNLTAGCLVQGKTIIITSQTGALYKSADNGVTFTSIPDLPSMSPNDVRELPDGSVIVAGGDGITILSAATLTV